MSGIALEGLNLNAAGGVYSFINVTATFIGPTTELVLGKGSNLSEEGIEIIPIGERNVLKRGAGGGGGHSMIGGSWATVKISLLQTSDANSVLQTAYDIQHTSSALWGKNQIIVQEHVSGDMIVCQGCAFKNIAHLPYKMEMSMIEWEFDCISMEAIRGKYNNFIKIEG